MIGKVFTYLGLSLLICSMVIPSSLHFGLFHWQQKQIRKEVKAHFRAGLKPNEISQFQFTQAQFDNLDWEGRDEFFWKGHKYDIVTVKEEAGKIKVQAWLDDKESELRKRFHSLLGKQQPHPQEQDLKLIDYFKNYFIESLNLPKAFARWEAFSSFWQASFSEAHLPTISPPPRQD